MARVTKSKEGHHFVITDDGSNLNKIRALPGRRWNDAVQNAWTVPYCREAWDALVKVGFVTPSNKPADLPSGYYVHRPRGETYLVIKTLGTPDDIIKCKRIPEARSYSHKDQGWICKPTQANIAYLRKNFPQLVWDGTAEHIADAMMQRNIDPNPQVKTLAEAQRRELETHLADEIDDYQFFTKGYQHQLNCFKLSRHLENFALFMEQGTGKAWVVVNTAAYLFEQGSITGLLVVCPNAMKEPWVEEFQKHLHPSYPLDMFMWEAKTRHKADQWILSVPPGERKLRVLIMNFDALSGETGQGIAKLFLSKHTCMFTVDESSKIKSAAAARTKAIIKLGRLASIRRILSGTPVTQGPLDLFTQFKFLDWQILGFSSFYSFRNRYALLGGWQGKQVVAYQYLDELKAKADTVSFRVLKKDCLDLPPKIYEKRVIELTAEQRRIYDQLNEEMKTEVVLEDGRPASSMIMHVITKIMRMQQVVGGFLTVDENEALEIPGFKGRPIDGGNPKLDALLDILDECADDQKVIIWARFRPELALIAQTLRKKYGDDSVVEFHGGVKDEDRQVGRRDFQDTESPARFLVGQPQAGGIGTTFTAASLMVYYSNDYSLETRLQSEDRFHRIGQTAEKVTIIDIMAKKTWDQKIVTGLRGKKSMADIITNDPPVPWV